MTKKQRSFDDGFIRAPNDKQAETACHASMSVGCIRTKVNP